MGDRGELPYHEIRVRSKTCLCTARRQDQSTFSHMLHKPAGIPPAREKARRKVYLQSDPRDIERHADDTAEQGKRIHPFIQKDETD